MHDPASRARGSIIIVDDNQSTAPVLMGMLTDHGYAVRCHIDESATLSETWAESPDLILLDIDLPQIDGYHLCRQIKADPRVARVPVILLGTLDASLDRARVFAAGGADYIPKPFQIDELLTKVETQIRLYTMRRPFNDQHSELHQETTEHAANQAISSDIINLKQAEEALQRSEERFRSIFEYAAIGICYSDLSGRLIRVNSHFCKITGYSAEELLQMTYRDITHPDDREIALDQNKKLFSSEIDAYSFPKRYIRKDGEIIWVNLTISLMRETSGSPLYEIGVIEDITERKQAEEALRQSEERLQQAVRVSHIGIFAHDHITDTIYWSPEQRYNYGWGLEEPVSLVKFLDQVYPEDRERIGAAVQRAHDPAGDGTFDVEHRIVRRDGAIRWLSTRSQTFFGGEGSARHPVRTVGAVLDVTESKLAEEARARLEEQLRQAQKLESIGQLAGGIAHDFNNLLVPMIGYAELGQAETSPGSKLYVDLEMIKTAAERAASLTRQLLAFSRRQVLEVQTFDLNEVIAGFQEILRRLITEDIGLEILLSSQACAIQADRTQIEQILLNLSVNARDAMPEGGKIIIETENVYFDETYVQTHAGTYPGHYVMLSFSDTGHGMDAETQRHVFEPFFTTKKLGKGTGLGLATVFGIVTQHQGNIWLYSEPGNGTTFKIYLPRAEGAFQLATTPSPEPISAHSSETVLVVEDVPMVRRFICETLEAFGYSVIEAESPDTSLQSALAYQGTIHLLLTDVIMPGMNGRELYERLAAVRPDLRVLYMSGYTDSVIVHHAVLDKGVNYLQKPFTVQSLIHKIRSVLGS